MKGIIIVFVAALLISGCDSRPLDHYFVGLSTPRGNEIHVAALHLDGEFGLPGGGLGCCWEIALATASIYDRKMPREIYANWYDQSEEMRFEATVYLPEDLTRRARALPGYTVTTTGRADPG